MKHFLCSFVVAAWVLCVQAIPLERRATVCDGLVNTRPGSGNAFCTVENNAFTFNPRSPAKLLKGKLPQINDVYICGKESTVSALHYAR